MSWSGDVTVRHGFATMEACDVKKEEYLAKSNGAYRFVSDCIGVPIREKNKTLKGTDEKAIPSNQSAT